MTRRVAAPPRSPYELTAGSALDDLHPVLRRYFAAIPPGAVGRGSGVFDTVGTPRRWLWPVLALLARGGVLFPVWEQNVPFSVVNAPLVDRDGKTAVLAVRRFHFGGGVREMVDAITAEHRGLGGLADHLGVERRFRVRLFPRVVRGELHLVSTTLEVRLGRRHLRLPARIIPRVTLVERFDDSARAGTATTPGLSGDGTAGGSTAGGSTADEGTAGEGAQRVSVTVDAPLIGRLYEYTGTFRYEVGPE